MKHGLLLVTALLFSFEAQATPQELIDNVRNNNLSGVFELLEQGENVNGVNSQGNTALHYAIANDSADISQLLLAYGADLNVANNKGWTPLKIAKEKQVKNVAPVLAQFASGKVELPPAVQKLKNDIEKQKEELAAKATAVENNLFPLVEEEATEVAKVEETVVSVADDKAASPQVVQKETIITEKAVIVNEPEKISAPDTVVKDSENQQVMDVTKVAELLAAQAVDQANQNLAKAKEEQAKSEAKAKSLETKVEALEAELKQFREQKAQEEALARVKAETKAKAEAVARAKAEAEAKAKAKEEAERKKMLATKVPAPKPQHTSAMSEKILVGDEEVVYCLNYLGQGENQNMLRAAGFYAAASGIDEARYNQIVTVSNDFFSASTNEALRKRNDECAKIITPKDKNRQNRIIRSLNQSVGY